MDSLPNGSLVVSWILLPALGVVNEYTGMFGRNDQIYESRCVVVGSWRGWRAHLFLIEIL